MNLNEFSEILRGLAGDAERMRPLLCEGDPLTCTVALVGANPGTTTPFWPFWNGEQGMDRRNWINAYLKQHDGKFGRSRSAIERFVPQVAARVVELNAFHAQSKRIADLERSRRNTEVMAFVLNSVRPKIIVCAGAHALNAVKELRLTWTPAVLKERHFIYWGRNSELDLAGRINGLL